MVASQIGCQAKKSRTTCISEPIGVIAMKDYESWKRQEISALRLRLDHDLQSAYLTEVISEIHPTILQMALEQFAKVAIERTSDSRININRVIEILEGE